MVSSANKTTVQDLERRKQPPAHSRKEQRQPCLSPWRGDELTVPNPEIQPAGPLVRRIASCVGSRWISQRDALHLSWYMRLLLVDRWKGCWFLSGLQHRLG